MRWGGKSCPQRAMSMRRKSPRVGAPAATDRCMGPVLLQTVRPAERMRAASSSMVVGGAS